ncbi:MAG TPA: dienelactone hydrolase family protein [Gemmatimonadales bacterium]|nr:dienelactone hydrolase family protein [Gemmatimonadales bacterium]
MRPFPLHGFLLLAVLSAACRKPATPTPADAAIPAGADSAAVRLAASTRHGEWATLPSGGTDTIRAWVVYPERRDRAPVVVVIHEIFGLTTWVRAVADQLAADGFIAVAPDLLSGKRLPMPPDSLASAPGGLDSAIAVISALDYGEVLRRIRASGAYGTALPAATDRWGVMGFCWGGSMVLATAAAAADLGAAVSFYGGVTPEEASLATVRAPTLALLAENDARVNETMAYADSSYRAAGVGFERVTYRGAGHGFLRAQGAHEGANLAASREAWPRAVGWLRGHLESGE